MNEHKTYTIRTVTDFATIPLDRIDAALKDFRQMIVLMKTINSFGGLGEDVNWCDKRTAFIWDDDGIEGCTKVNIELINKTKETAQ